MKTQVSYNNGWKNFEMLNESEMSSVHGGRGRFWSFLKDFIQVIKEKDILDPDEE